MLAVVLLSICSAITFGAEEPESTVSIAVIITDE
jgi:hypothetical protein